MHLMKFEENRFILLFISLMLYFLLPPFFIDTPHRMHLISGLFSLILVLSVYAIEKNKRVLRLGIVLAAFVFGVQWYGVIYGMGPKTGFINTSVTCFFFGVTSIAVIFYIIRSEEVTASTIFGAICGYMLLGLTFSFLHLLIFAVNHQAYAFPTAISNVQQIKTLNFIYFSFITLSTVGYGDITPVSHVARTISWMEGITGQVYLTVWIARLIALHITHERHKE